MDNVDGHLIDSDTATDEPIKNKFEPYILECQELAQEFIKSFELNGVGLARCMLTVVGVLNAFQNKGFNDDEVIATVRLILMARCNFILSNLEHFQVNAVSSTSLETGSNGGDSTGP